MNTRAASLPPLMSKVKMEPPPFGKYFLYSSLSLRPSMDGWEMDSTSGTVFR